METVSTVRARIRTRLQDPLKKIWTDADILQYLNLACVDLQEQTQWMEDWSITNVTSGTAAYTRDSDKVQNMTLQAYDAYRIDAIDIYELDRAKPDWRNDPNGVPTRIYRSDWNTDSLWSTPNTTGDTFTFSSELGIIIRITDSASANSLTLNQETGIIIYSADNTKADDWFFVRITYTDPTSADLGIIVRLQSPYQNIENVFSRYPDLLVNDSDPVPFPDFAHSALEYFVMMKCYLKEGDGANARLAQTHQMAYQQIWIPWVKRMSDARIPDMPLIWKLQIPGDPHPPNYSHVNPIQVG